MVNPSLQMPGFSVKGLRELGKRLFFSLIALVIYRVGCYIPLPGVDTELLAASLGQADTQIINYFSMISGSAFSVLTIFSLGLLPYIQSSIIFKFLTVLIPSLEKLRKEEGEVGRRKINQYIRYATVGLAIFYSFIHTRKLVYLHRIIEEPSIGFFMNGMLTLIAASVFLMWLSEQITERGIGNGSSLIISAGIISDLPPAIVHFIEQFRAGKVSLLIVLCLLMLVAIVTGFVVFMERAQRKIAIHYPKRQQGRHIYAAQSSHLPLKLNMAGVMPAIFVPGIMSTLVNVLGWISGYIDYAILKTLTVMLSPGHLGYLQASAALITFFCFGFTAVDPDTSPSAIATNLKKTGAFIPGIRPGEHSIQYIAKIMTRLTVISCFYLLPVLLLPDLLVMYLNLTLAFGGTALMIVVLVIMEAITQIQSLLMSYQYEALLKKAGLKGNIPIR